MTANPSIRFISEGHKVFTVHMLLRLLYRISLSSASPMLPLLLAVSLTLCAVPDARALLLADNQGSELPFDVTYQQSPSLSFNHVLSVRNGSLVPSLIVSWQLGLELHPTAGALGTVKFSAISPPEDSLFGSEPGPMSDLVTASDKILASDADLDFIGKVISANTWHRIVNLTITASPDAVGTFELVSPVFNPLTPDQGSSWFPFLAFEPEGFENSISSSESGYFLLGTIHISAASPLGDYNDDTVVDELDYSKWRSEFGQTVSPPGVGSDGNNDGVVDAADYIIWRKARTNPLELGQAVPEPGILTLALVFLGVTTWISAGRMRRSVV